ncbi:MAG: TerC family protein [Gemmatimonadetes bacterium]|nr:TerC family protein [Gemmatimonadota bacterium]
MEWISTPEAWVALATLTILEIVLGIDNVVFIAIVAGRLPEKEQGRAWKIGLGLAMVSRLALLFSIVWIMRLTEPFFSVLGREFSGKDLILIAGGLFLLGKSTRELHHNLEGDRPGRDSESPGWSRSFGGVLTQIVALDIIFSLDSVITAVGIADQVAVMAIAIIIAVGVMMASAETISAFVRRHPTVKMLALSFLLLIGMALVAEGFGQHIPKGYLYFAMGFSIFVEMLNLKAAKKPVEPVKLRGSLPKGG